MNRRSGSDFQLCYLFAVWSWEIYLPSLSLNVLNSKKRTVVTTCVEGVSVIQKGIYLINSVLQIIANVSCKY